MRRAFSLVLLAGVAGIPMVASAAGGPAPGGAAGGNGAASQTAADASYVLFQKDPTASTKSVFNFDYGPPSSPALNLLGLTPDKTPPAASLKAFVFSAPALFGGQSGQSLAFDFAPAALLPQSKTTFDSYIKDYGQRLGFRTRISLGALNGDNGGGDPSKAVNSKAALGFSTSLLDYSDPLMTGGEKGQSLLLRCLAGYQTIAEPILKTGDAYVLSTEDAAEQGALNLVQQALVDSQGKVTLEMRKGLAAYIPGAVAPADAPAPAQKAPAPLSARAKLVQDLMQQLSDVQDPKAKVALQTIGKILQEDAPGDTAAPVVAGPAPPAKPPTQLNDPDFLKAYAAELDKINAKQDAAVAANLKSENAALDKAGVIAGEAACADQASRLATFSPNLQIGAGMLEQGDAGRLEHLKRDGTVAWGAFKFPLQPAVFAAAVAGQPVDQTPTSALMGFVSGRFGWSETVMTGDKTTPMIRADTSDAWVGMEWITQNYRLAAQYGWTSIRALDGVGKPFQKSGQAYLLSGQVQLGDKDSPIWLGLSYGNGYGTATTLKAQTALVTLSFNPAKPPDLSTPKT